MSITGLGWECNLFIWIKSGSDISRYIGHNHEIIPTLHINPNLHFRTFNSTLTHRRVCKFIVAKIIHVILNIMKCLICFLYLLIYNTWCFDENRDISRKSSSRTIATISSRLRTSVGATKGVSSVCEPLPPDRPLWFPGSSPPDWLDGR